MPELIDAINAFPPLKFVIRDLVTVLLCTYCTGWKVQIPKRNSPRRKHESSVRYVRVTERARFRIDASFSSLASRESPTLASDFFLQNPTRFPALSSVVHALNERKGVQFHILWRTSEALLALHPLRGSDPIPVRLEFLLETHLKLCQL